MMWRCACAAACVLFFVSAGGCAGSRDNLAGSTASLGGLADAFAANLKPALGDAQQRAREDAIIAQAIAAHEMRNP